MQNKKQRVKFGFLQTTRGNIIVLILAVVSVDRNFLFHCQNRAEVLEIHFLLLNAETR